MVKLIVYNSVVKVGSFQGLYPWVGVSLPCVLQDLPLCLCPNLLFLQGHQSYFFNLITSAKTLSPVQSHLRYWGV